MKLYFQPSPLWEPVRCHYAAEQMMLTLFPGEEGEHHLLGGVVAAHGLPEGTGLKIQLHCPMASPRKGL